MNFKFFTGSRRSALIVARYYNTHTRGFFLASLICWLAAFIGTLIWLNEAAAEPWVALAGLLACLIFGGLQQFAQIYDPPGKPLSQMSSSELLSVVFGSNPKTDWRTVRDWTKRETYFESDPKLRFKSDDSEPYVENFAEPWAVKFPNPSAASYRYELYYDNNLIDRFILVSVDGGRCSLPMPVWSGKMYSNQVSKTDYHVATIHDDTDTVDDYLARAGLSVIGS